MREQPMNIWGKRLLRKGTAGVKTDTVVCLRNNQATGRTGVQEMRGSWVKEEIGLISGIDLTFSSLHLHPLLSVSSCTALLASATSPLGYCSSLLNMGLSDSANENTGHSNKYKFQIKQTFF